jgi:hypothetical protein
MQKPLFTVLACLLSVGVAFGWSEPHLAITHAALRVLPQGDRDFLGEELQFLGDRYCLIPDHVFSDPANARFAMMETRPGERYLTILHLPTTPPEYEEVLRYFMGKAVDAFRENRKGDGARYCGTICHLIEDYASPSHVVPGDNMLTMMRQFVRPSTGMRHRLMHGPVESGSLAVSIEGYAPRILGNSVNEMAWRLTHRIHEGIVNARSTTVPILRALDEGDQKAADEHRLRAARLDACIVADALVSILWVSQGHSRGEAAPSLDTASLGGLYPLEAPALYYPQKQFFGSPNWGHPTHGYLLRDGEHEEPLRLRVAEEGAAAAVREFSEGIASGGRSTLTYGLPHGVFSRFQAWVGMQVDLGAEGAADFTVLGDGRVLAQVGVEGAQVAVRVDCAVSGVRQLQLVTAGRGALPKKNYTVWGGPTLVK